MSGNEGTERRYHPSVIKKEDHECALFREDVGSGIVLEVPVPHPSPTGVLSFGSLRSERINC